MSRAEPISIEQLEALVRDAQFEDAREHLELMISAGVNRNALARVANIANRVARPMLALRLLAPVFNNPADSASTRELVEYSHALRRLGAADQAYSVLERAHAEATPELCQQRANALSTLYRFSEAVPWLEKIISMTERAAYAGKVARINLLAASIFIRDDQRVKQVIVELNELLDPQKTSLLYGNFLELQGRWHAQNGRFAKAIEILEGALAFMANAPGTWDALQVEKWLAVSRSYVANAVLPELAEVKAKAVASRQWEVVRDCEFHIARIRKDRHMLEKLYFGTPFEPFRERIMQELGTAPAAYLWPGRAAQTLDLKSGLVDGRSVGLKVGQLPHRLLCILAADFFRPQPIVSVYAQLFPGTYFDPASSTTKVFNVIRRTRHLLRSHGLPVKIITDAACLKLVAEPGQLAIRVEPRLTGRDANVILLERIRSQAGRTFTCTAASEILGHSPATSLRLLNWALQAGHLKALGNGRGRRYFF